MTYRKQNRKYAATISNGKALSRSGWRKHASRRYHRGRRNNSGGSIENGRNGVCHAAAQGRHDDRKTPPRQQRLNMPRRAGDICLLNKRSKHLPLKHHQRHGSESISIACIAGRTRIASQTDNRGHRVGQQQRSRSAGAGISIKQRGKRRISSIAAACLRCKT